VRGRSIGTSKRKTGLATGFLSPHIISSLTNRRGFVVIWERRTCPRPALLTRIVTYAHEVPGDQDSFATQAEGKMNREDVPFRRSAGLRWPIRPA
jgi:hypothetical protein